MTTKDFEEFIANQQEAGPGIDSARIREEWLKELESLYKKILGFLEKYIAAGSIMYSFTEIEITEPEIGTYRAKRMDLRIGRQRVSLVPVGTMLIGCRGRVDIDGVAGRAQILLVDERARTARDLIKVSVRVGVGRKLPPQPPPPPEPSSWAWKILTRSVERQFMDLEKESFFEVVMEVANA
jgi:hypothetical protein